MKKADRLKVGMLQVQLDDLARSAKWRFRVGFIGAKRKAARPPESHEEEEITGDHQQQGQPEVRRSSHNAPCFHLTHQH